jgi:hypothetical protein
LGRNRAGVNIPEKPGKRRGTGTRGIVRRAEHIADLLYSEGAFWFVGSTYLSEWCAKVMR